MVTFKGCSIGLKCTFSMPLTFLLFTQLNSNLNLRADYYRLRVGGLILAAVLCLIGITILLSKTKMSYTLSHTCEWIYNLESRWLYSNLNSNIVVPKAGRNKRKLVVVVGKSYFQVIVSVNTLVELNKTIKWSVSAIWHSQSQSCHNDVMRWNLMFKLGSVMPKHVIVFHILLNYLLNHTLLLSIKYSLTLHN